MGQVPHVMPSTARTIVDVAPEAMFATNARTSRTTRMGIRSLIAFLPCCGPRDRAAVHDVCEQIGRELREAVEHDRCPDHEARDDEQRQGDATACHPARESRAASSLADVEEEACGHPEDSRGDQQPAVLHRYRHERAAPKAEDNDREREQTAE